MSGLGWAVRASGCTAAAAAGGRSGVGGGEEWGQVCNRVVDPLLYRGWVWGREGPRVVASSLAALDPIEDPVSSPYPPDAANPALSDFRRELFFGGVKILQAVARAKAKISC